MSPHQPEVMHQHVANDFSMLKILMQGGYVWVKDRINIQRLLERMSVTQAMQTCRKSAKDHHGCRLGHGCHWCSVVLGAPGPLEPGSLLLFLARMPCLPGGEPSQPSQSQVLLFL